MNDFADDSIVKFYLNRRGPGALEEEDEDQTLTLATKRGAPVLRLDVSPPPGAVTPERFSSPSARFALQLFIFPDDLPDGMVFDPHTEAIVFKDTLRDRSQTSAAVNPGISQMQRRKFFTLAKNITVAEVIELGLERFGILEGVVDGGDEVEDKLTKRRSASRVRYVLVVQVDGQGMSFLQREIFGLLINLFYLQSGSCTLRARLLMRSLVHLSSGGLLR